MYFLIQHLAMRLQPIKIKNKNKIIEILLINKKYNDESIIDNFTSGILCKALSKLRFRWCCVKLILVFVTCETGGKSIPIDLEEK